MKQLPFIKNEVFETLKSEKIESRKMNYLKGGDGEGDGTQTTPDPNPLNP